MQQMLAELPAEKRLRLQAKAADRRRNEQESSHSSRDKAHSIISSAESSSQRTQASTDSATRNQEAEIKLQSMSHREGQCRVTTAMIEGEPSMLSTKRLCEIPSLGAACDDCRRKHKRCHHRLAMRSRSNAAKYRKRAKLRRRRSTARVPQASEIVNKRTAGGSSSPANRLGRASKRLVQAGYFTAPFAGSTLLTSGISVDVNAGISWDNGRSLSRDHQSLKTGIEIVPTSKRGYIPRPPNLTKNGKRRGRPPKYLAQSRQQDAELVLCQLERPGGASDSESGQHDYKPRKRRAIDDYEFSEKFDEVILGKAEKIGDSSDFESNANDDASWCADGSDPRSEASDSSESNASMPLTLIPGRLSTPDKISIESLLNPPASENLRQVKSIHSVWETQNRQRRSLLRTSSRVPLEELPNNNCVPRNLERFSRLDFAGGIRCHERAYSGQENRRPLHEIQDIFWDRASDLPRETSNNWSDFDSCESVSRPQLLIEPLCETGNLPNFAWSAVRTGFANDQ